VNLLPSCHRAQTALAGWLDNRNSEPLSIQNGAPQASKGVRLCCPTPGVPGMKRMCCQFPRARPPTKVSSRYPWWCQRNLDPKSPTQPLKSAAIMCCVLKPAEQAHSAKREDVGRTYLLFATVTPKKQRIRKAQSNDGGLCRAVIADDSSSCLYVTLQALKQKPCY